MTSISAASIGYLSPLQQLQKELRSEVTAGKVSAVDQDALTSALTDIDTPLQTSRSSGLSAKRTSPDDLKAKIDDLISGEVSSGKLTKDQAIELREVFEKAFSRTSPGGAGGPPPPTSDGAVSSDDAGSASGGSTTEDLLQQFIKALQESLSSSSRSYGASGDTDNIKSISALLVDYQT
jgi:hypothetical protein